MEGRLGMLRVPDVQKHGVLRSLADQDYGLSSGRRSQRWRQRSATLALLLFDVVFALAVWEVVILARAAWSMGAVSVPTLVSIIPGVAVWIVLRALLGLYPGYGLSSVEELRRQTYATLGTFTTIAIFALVLQVGDNMSRFVLCTGFLALLVLAPCLRQFTKWWLMRAGLWGKPIIVFSSGEAGEAMATLLSIQWGLGYRPLAVFGGRPGQDRRNYEIAPDEESLKNATSMAREFGVDTIIFAMPHTRREHLQRLVHRASFDFRHVTVIPNLGGVANSGVVARDLAGVFGVEIRYNLLDPQIRRIKRTLDLVATTIGGLLILPLLLTISMLVWLESGGPVFYADKRMGRNGQLFSCLKFRTMVPDAEDVLRRILQQDPAARAELHGIGLLAGLLALAGSVLAVPGTPATTSCAKTRGSPGSEGSSGRRAWTSCRSCGTC